MKRTLWIVLLLCALAVCCVAEERVALNGFSFVPPDGLLERTLTDEARQSGAVYAAQSEDGSLRVLVTVEPIKRAATGQAAVAQDVNMGEPIAVGDAEFSLGTQTVSEGEKDVYFRAATAVRDGMRYTLFFVDYDGTHGNDPAIAAQSVQWDGQDIAKEGIVK